MRPAFTETGTQGRNPVGAAVAQSFVLDGFSQDGPGLGRYSNRTMMRSLSLPAAWVAALGMALPGPCPAQDAPPPPAGDESAPKAPAVVKTGDHQFKVGLIEFDSRSREVRFPAWVNMPKGMIEFPVVHRNGRVHEAIFATDALPLHLETVLRLLRYKPSKEVFPTYPGIDLKNPPPHDQWPAPVYAAPDPAAHVQVFARWAQGTGTPIEVDVREMLYRAAIDNDGNETSRIRFQDKASHWVFTGSTEQMKETVESLGGAIVGVRPEEECCINTVRNEAVQEGEWFADPSRVPAVDTPVTILIRPAMGNRPAAAPAPDRAPPQAAPATPPPGAAPPPTEAPQPVPTPQPQPAPSGATAPPPAPANP